MERLKIQGYYGGPDQWLLEGVQRNIAEKGEQWAQAERESLPCPVCGKTEFTGFPGNASDIQCDTCEDSGRVEVCCAGPERCIACKDTDGLREVWPSRLKVEAGNVKEEPVLEALQWELKYGTKNVRIAIQKDGRLSALSWELLKTCIESAGMMIPERNPQNRRMNYPIIGKSGAQILTVRNSDIPKLVESGMAKFGIVGDDTLLEQDSTVRIIERLDACKSSLTAMLPKDSPIKTVRELGGKRIVAAYPNMTKRFLKTLNIQPESIDELKSVEATVGAGLFDAGFDLVETGNTMAANGVKPLARMRTFEAVVVAK